MFRPVSSKVNLPEMEKGIHQFWMNKEIFRRTDSDREGQPVFMLYEGPPTANGSPGIHHVLARVFKDVICRYKTMKGYRCVRKGGWDTHGLPVELEVERELGLKSKRDIEAYGIEKFNQKCRESVFRYVKEWEDMTARIGFWVDMENPYVTMENDYIETGWWILRQLWDKGLLYQDLKGTPHCPRCVTSLSSHEVALGYQENTPDPSVYVKFPLSTPIDESEVPTYFLAWTTTPWTLPGNTALAVAKDAEYSLIEIEGANGPERLIMASALVDQVIKEHYSVVRKYKGSQIAKAGLAYDNVQAATNPTDFQYYSLYDPSKFGVEIRCFQTTDVSGVGMLTTLESAEDFQTHIVVTDFVSMEEGTGIVHIAPAFGDEDLGAGRRHNLAFVQPVDLQGVVIGDYPFAGKFVKDADEEIMADLEKKGLLYHRGVYKHTYPFCWRCSSPLLYYAKPSWYIRTTAFNDRLVSGNGEINWYPEYIKEGRFGEWLRNNVDWAISRERYWGTPIPIWSCDNCGHRHCIGSREELKEMAVPEHKALLDGPSAGSGAALDLHRPYVDQVGLCCPQSGCQGEMKRIPEVMDAWFDSGAMPYAQWHYPFDGSDTLDEGRFPADYICEAVDQTRGWFYTLHALSTLLMDQPCYRNVICLGLILDGQGQKMSKHLGNVVDPWSVLDAHGADATRWYLFTASQPGESRRFSQDLVKEVVRRFLLTLWNVYSFFTTYAVVDRFHPSQVPRDWKPTSELDRWLLSELNVLVSQVDSELEGYNPTDAGRRIQEFADLLSNWYVRRSRRRFWKSENDEDKISAYATLYACLTSLSKLLAPFTPFIAEEMYQNLVRSVDESAPESVHLASFPEASADMVDQPLMDATRLAMRISSMGRGARSRAGVKVRQPVRRVLVKTQSPSESKYMALISLQVMDELNIKESPYLVEESSALYQASLAKAGDQPETVVEVSWSTGIPDGDDSGERRWSVSLQAGYMVAIDTTITPELADEGLARELVHRIQNLRRAAGFEITDRINTYYQGPQRIAEVMGGEHAGYIQQETLSDELVDGEAAEGAHAEHQKLDGMELALAVRRVDAGG